MTTSVGVDYSTKFIYVATTGTGRKLPTVFKQEVLDAANTVKKLNALFCDLAILYGATRIGVEQSWSSYNPHTGMQMTRIATLIEVAVGTAGLEYEPVHPAKWRKELFGTNMYLDRLGRRQKLTKKMYKNMAINFATECGLKTDDDNYADAFCIAKYIEKVRHVGDTNSTGTSQLRLREGE